MDTIKSKNDSLYWWKLDSLYVGNLLKTHTIELYSHLSLILLSPPSKKKNPQTDPGCHTSVSKKQRWKSQEARLEHLTIF